MLPQQEPPLASVPVANNSTPTTNNRRPMCPYPTPLEVEAISIPDSPARVLAECRPVSNNKNKVTTPSRVTKRSLPILAREITPPVPLRQSNQLRYYAAGSTSKDKLRSCQSPAAAKKREPSSPITHSPTAVTRTSAPKDSKYIRSPLRTPKPGSFSVPFSPVTPKYKQQQKQQYHTRSQSFDDALEPPQVRSRQQPSVANQRRDYSNVSVSSSALGESSSAPRDNANNENKLKLHPVSTCRSTAATKPFKPCGMIAWYPRPARRVP